MVYTFRWLGVQIFKLCQASFWLVQKMLRAVSCGRIHVTNFKTLSSTKALQKLCKSSASSSASSSAKALQKLCTKLRTKFCKSSTKGFAAPLPTRCTGHVVDGVCSAQGVPRGSPPWSSAQSPIRSSKALLTRSANILGRFCNRPYNDQSPYNCLYKRLYERLYKRLHDRPYKRPYNQLINRSNAHTID